MSLPGGSTSASMSLQIAQSSLDNDFDFPQMVYDLIASIESGKESKEEVVKKVKAFKQKVSQCKELLKKMPGIDQSPEDQQQTLIKYQEELQQKKEALQKLKHFELFTSAAAKKED